MASSDALTARMQKQMERRAAKQAAKKAALQTSDGVRRIQKTARAGENTFKAAKAAVEAAAKTVQSMIAALGAAGAVMVLLTNCWKQLEKKLSFLESTKLYSILTRIFRGVQKKKPPPC